jgi:hypothetical protein
VDLLAPQQSWPRRPEIHGCRIALLYSSLAVRSGRKQQTPTCGPRSTRILQCFARLPSRIFRSPLHPIRTCVCYLYRSRLRLGCVRCHRPLLPPAQPLALPLLLLPVVALKLGSGNWLSIWSRPPKPLEISRSVSPIPSSRQISLPPKL